MSARGFKSVFTVGGIAAAALGCYLVSLRVASERAALEGVENKIVLAQRDIRMLNTEIGTRGRLAQLERWNVKVIRLSAPTADQFVESSFQLATLVRPDAKPAIEAPVVLASAPAPRSNGPVVTSDSGTSDAAPRTSRALGEMMHVASYSKPEAKAPRMAARPGDAPIARATPQPAAAAKSVKPAAAAKSARTAAAAKPVKTATADPLGPLSAMKRKAKSGAKNDGGTSAARTTTQPTKDPGSP